MRRPGLSLLVALFVVLDVGVIALGYRATHRPVPLTDQAAQASLSASERDTDSATSAPITGPLSLAMGSDGSLARATRGSCEERTRVRARVWLAAGFKSALNEVRVPGLEEVLGMDLRGRRVDIVGADESCKIHGWRSTDGGKTWKQGRVRRTVPYLDPDTTSTTAHGPMPVNAVCPPTAIVARAGDGPVVSCAPSMVVTYDAQGKAGLSYSATGLVAAVPLPDGRIAGLATSSKCGAALLVLGSGEDEPQTLSCITPGTDQAVLGLAASGQRVAAQVGYRLYVSTDGGRTFAVDQDDPVAKRVTG